MRKLLTLIVVAFVFLGCENATEKRKRMEENFAQQNYQGAISIAQELCDPKDLNSCKILADSYFNSDNHTKAFKIYYETLCNGDDQYGCFMSGWMKLKGMGIRQDVGGGLKLLNLACENGYAQACNKLAGYYDEQNTDHYSQEKSLDYLRKSCFSNDQEACNKVKEYENLMKQLKAKSEREKTQKTFDLCLENKNADACFGIAKKYLNATQFSTALEYFEKACEYGNSSSCTFAGRLRMFGNDFALVNKEKALNHFKKACTSVNTCLDYLDFVQKEFDLFNFPKSERAQTFSLAKQLCEKDFKEGGPKKFSDDVNKELKDIIEIGLEDSVYKAINYGSLAQNLYREKYLGAFDVANACYIAGVFETQDDDFKAGQEYFLRSCYYGKIEACKIAEQNLKGEKNIEKLKTLYYSICIEDDKKRSDRFRSNVCLDGATFYSRLKNFKTANEMLNRSCELGNFKSCYLLAIGNSKYQAFGKSQLAHSNKLNEKDAIFYYAQFLLAKGQKIPNESFEKIVDYCQSGIVDFCELQQAIGGSGEKQ